MGFRLSGARVYYLIPYLSLICIFARPPLHPWAWFARENAARSFNGYALMLARAQTPAGRTARVATVEAHSICARGFSKETERNGMRWNEVERNGMKWNEME